MRGFSRLAVLFLIAAPAFAQAPIDPAKLPAETLLYIRSSGLKLQPDSAQKNSLLALWNDPDFAPVRAALFESRAGGNEKEGKGARWTAADFQRFLPLLEKPLIFGVLLRLPGSASGANDASDKPSPTQVFAVYDDSGNEALARAFLDRLHKTEAEPPQISPVTIGSVRAEKVVRKSGTTYRAFLPGKLVIATDEATLGDILDRLPKGAKVVGLLGESSAFAEAQREVLPGNTLEFFLRVPDLAALAGSIHGPQAAQVQELVKGLHTEAIHAVCASVSFDRAETRFHGAILGDASAGTLFDIVPDGSARMASLTLVPATAVSYNASQFDLLNFYHILRNTLEASLPPNQAGMIPMVEGMAAMKLGMPLESGLRVFSGEYASFTSRDDFDPSGNVYAFGITSKPDGLKLVHSLATLAGDRVAISDERDEGETTFLGVSFSNQKAAGTAQTKFWVALTPNFLLGSLQAETLHTLLAGKAAGSPRLASEPGFQQARSHFPEKVIGISYADFSRVNWAAALGHMLEQVKSAQAAKGDASQETKVLELFKPDVLRRHLHTTAGASWKDAHGVHFDGWIQ